MPAFNGIDIFGRAVQMRTADNPRADQRSGFFGLQGLESLDGGHRGRITSVKGVLYGSDLAVLNFAEALFRSYLDPFAYTLVDTRGRVWPGVKLTNFEPTEAFSHDATGYFLPYQAQFLHLIQ